MNWRKSQINGIKQFGSLTGLNLKGINNAVKPGQLIYIFQQDIDDHIRPLTVVKKEENLLWFSGNLNRDWHVGDKVFFRGPIGNGFQPLSFYEKLLFIIPGATIGSLTPLIDEAILRNKNISVACNNFVSQLKAESEIISLDDIEFAIDWADYVYLECGLEDLQIFARIIKYIKKSGIPSEIFIQTAILCGGTADCMVCAVKTRRGFQQVCKTGPVFLISELDIN